MILQPIHEFNPCHNPAGTSTGGQFCSQDVTRVGITSYRPKGDPNYRSPHQVVGNDLKQFADKLRTLPGVKNVSAAAGTGAYAGGWEPTWIIGYRGNGEARKLVAETAAKYHQEAVLFMHRGGKDPAVELQFRGHIVPGPVRKAISDVLRAEGLGGWTWGKRGVNTVLRAVSVPQWGGNAQDHLAAMQRVSEALTVRGLYHRVRTKYVETEVIDSAQYAAVARGEA